MDALIVFLFFFKLLWEGKDLKVQYRSVTSHQNCLEQEDGMWTLITVTMVVTPVAGVSRQQIESLRVSDANFYRKAEMEIPRNWEKTYEKNRMNKTRWFETCFIFTPTWGNDPIWQIRKKTLRSGIFT